MKSQTPLTLYNPSKHNLLTIDFTPVFKATAFHDEYKSYNTYLSLKFNTPSFSEQAYDAFLQNELAEESTLASFKFLRQSTIKSFFNSQLVDVPICFQKSKSLYTPTFEIPLIKMSNIIMRSGLRGQVMRQVTGSFAYFFHNLIQDLTPSEACSWHHLHHILDNIFVTPGTHFNLLGSSIVGAPMLPAENQFEGSRIKFNHKMSVNYLLFETLMKNAPIFSFYVRKVDKSIRKNSRGKSGKYTIIWKYIPVYKRLYATLRWLLKELKFQKLKTLETRLVHMLQTFLVDPNSSFVIRLRKFVHGFVFYNYKTTLLKQLKSTS